MHLKNIIAASLLTAMAASQPFTASAAPTTKEFFQPVQTLSATLSPNSEHIALVKSDGEVLRLETYNTLNKSTQTLLDLSEFTEKDSYINNVDWVDNNTLTVYFIEETKGVQSLRDTKSRSYVLVVDLPKNEKSKPVIKSIRTSGELISSASGEDNTLYYAINRNHSKIYKLNTKKLHPHKKKLNKLMKRDGGQFKAKNTVVDIDGYALRWFFANEKPVAVAYIDGDRFTEEEAKTRDRYIFSKINEDGSIEKIHGWTADALDNDDESIIWPYFTRNGETFYGYDVNAEHRRIVYKIDYKAKTEEPVFEVFSGEIINVLLHHETGEFIGARVLENGQVQDIYQFSNGEQQVEATQELFSIIGGNEEQKTMLYYFEDYQTPGQYWFVRDGEKTLVASELPALNKQLHTRQLQNTKTVESLDIPYQLTLPEQHDQQLPLIVLPHGGPIGPFDDQYFDREVQFLAANGYAVLQVNFRGSGGYSDELLEAGKQQWGTGILQDIEQVTREVIKRDDIDGKHVCVVGASYGGYAATMLTIKHPDLFQCGVNYAGVSDLPLWLRTTETSEKQRKFSDEHFGHPLKDFAMLNEWSTLYHVQNLSKPLMIIHGEKDEVVDVEHAWRLKMMLDKHNKTYEWKLYPEMGHSGDLNEDMVDKYQRILKFLEENI